MLIRVKNLKLKTILGVYEWEKNSKRELIFNIEVETKNTKSLFSDKLSDTIDYDDIVKTIKKVSLSKFNLIEKLAGEILKELMKNKKIFRCKIEIAKVGAVKEAESCCVIIETKRNSKK